MTTLTVSRTIGSPLKVTWTAFAEDFGGIYKFHPRVKHSPLISSISSGLGTARRCEFHDGSKVDEEIVGWDKEKELRIELTNAAMPLNDISAIIQFEAINEKSCTVSFTMKYTPKFGPLGWLMDRVMLRPMMNKILLQVLDGLDRHLATGEIIDQPGKHSGPVAGAA